MQCKVKFARLKPLGRRLTLLDYLIFHPIHTLVGNHRLGLIIEQDGDQVLRKIVQEAIEPLADTVVLFLGLARAVGRLVVVDVINY